MASPLDLHIGDVTTSAQGVKSAAITGSDATFILSGLTAPFGGPNTYDGKQCKRMSLGLRLTEEATERLTRIDEWAKKYVAANAPRLLGKRLEAGEEERLYVHNVRRDDGFEPVGRFKVNVDYVNYWDEKNEPGQPPAYWFSDVVDMCCQARFWTSCAGFGVSLTVTDVRVVGQAPHQKRKCPWS